MPQISIVIPVYNGEVFLRETLDSIKNQTFRDFECVIVDDGSTDNSLQLINEYVELDNRFVVNTIPNSGSADLPIKYGVSVSASEYIMVIGHDDSIETEYLEKSLLRQKQTSADIVILQMVGCVDGLKGKLWNLPLDDWEYNKVIKGLDAVSYTIGGWQIPCNGMLIKKKLYDDLIPIKYMNADEYTSRVLLSRANSVAFAPAIYFYRNHQTSISRKMSSKVFDRIMTDELLDIFVKEHFDEKDEVSIKMRNTRFYNLVYLQSDFIKYKSQFKKDIQKEISMNFIQVYYSQNRKRLSEELPVYFKPLFLTNYFLFKLSSFLYVMYKDRNGRKYLMK